MPTVNGAVGGMARCGTAPSSPCRSTTEHMSALPQAVNLAEKFSLFTDHWQPRVVGDLNGQHVKLVKLLGEFVWHHHDHEDELFLVLRGKLRMEFAGGHRDVGPGEFIVVPRGVEHRPVAAEEVHVLLFEPASTLNTGNVRDERTVDRPTRL
jgi:mannose-6-phosphate isomerase-like protein (cupin superfamily)